MIRGRAGLDEAIVSLREATRESSGDLHAVAALALALALDRRGDTALAKEILSSWPMGDPRDRVQTSVAKTVFAMAPSEAFAASALALELAGERAGARDAWLAALGADPVGPWADYARGHAGAARPTPRQGP